MTEKQSKKQTIKRKSKRGQFNILIDGIWYKVPASLRGCTNEEIERVIRGWKPGAA